MFNWFKSIKTKHKDVCPLGHENLALMAADFPGIDNGTYQKLNGLTCLIDYTQDSRPGYDFFSHHKAVFPTFKRVCAVCGVMYVHVPHGMKQ
jgi:hypothetical protein